MWRKADRPNTVNIRLSVFVAASPLRRWLGSATEMQASLEMLNGDVMLNGLDCVLHFDRLEVDGGEYGRFLEIATGSGTDSDPRASKKFAPEGSFTKFGYGTRGFVYLSNLDLAPMSTAYFADEAQTRMIIPVLAIPPGQKWMASVTNIKFLFVVLEV